jgi:hypothetical protein
VDGGPQHLTPWDLGITSALNRAEPLRAQKDGWGDTDPCEHANSCTE